MKRYIIIATVLVIIGAVAFGFLSAVASKLALFDMFLTVTPSTPFVAETNILLLGVDDAFGHRSDTIMVLHVNPESRSISLVSIPRDTLAVLPGRGLDKINHAYAYGGVEMSRAAVENLLGIKIPYYIIVNLAGIINIIDDLGGININVEDRMYYIDYAGGLFIDLKPGLQRLSGKQLMGYLRYRRDGGDLHRINRQQQFMRALADELMKKENMFRTPKLFLTLLSQLDTNLSSRQSLGLGLGVRSAWELGRVSMHVVPGFDMMVDGIYYLKPDLTRIRDISQKFRTSS